MRVSLFFLAAMVLVGCDSADRKPQSEQIRPAADAVIEKTPPEKTPQAEAMYRVFNAAVIPLALEGFPRSIPAIAQVPERCAGQTLKLCLSLAAGNNHNPVTYAAVYDDLAELYEDPEHAENVILFYTNRSQSKQNRDHGGADPDAWNREHLWPQSHGVSDLPMKTDLHALRPADKSVNSSRGELDFDNGGSPQGEAPATYSDRDSFEPRDAIKGDIARSLFYMDVRYEGKNGEPDLQIVDRNSASGSTELGYLCTLLAWHEQDPVTADERRVNNAIEAIQGNRNPFVDQPQLATAFYQDRCGD